MTANFTGNESFQENGSIHRSEFVDRIPYALGLFISLAAIILNGFLLLVLAKERKAFLHMRVTYYIINLGIADFLTSAATIVLIMTRIFETRIPETYERIVTSLNWITTQCSFYTLLAMSVDRIVIVLYSLSWSNILTIRRANVAIACCWLVSIVGGISLHFYLTETLLALTSVVELTIVVFICNSCFIYTVLRKREKTHCITTVSRSHTIEIQRISFPPSRDNMSRVVITLIVILIITQLPFVICFQMWLIYLKTGWRSLEIVRSFSFVRTYSFLQSFACLNFALNPIVYGWRIKKYREAFASALC